MFSDKIQNRFGQLCDTQIFVPQIIDSQRLDNLAEGNQNRLNLGFSIGNRNRCLRECAVLLVDRHRRIAKMHDNDFIVFRHFNLFNFLIIMITCFDALFGKGLFQRHHNRSIDRDSRCPCQIQCF